MGYQGTRQQTSLGVQARARVGGRRWHWEIFVVHAVLLAAGTLFVLPLLWMVSTALKPDTQLFAYPPEWIPKPPMWSNFRRAVEYIPFVHYTINTVYVSSMVVGGTLISSLLPAYSFSRIRWVGRNVLFGVVIATMILPYEVTMVPQYIIFRKLGWIGTYWPLIVPAFLGSPFFIFLLRQFLLTIPEELADAARIDGASEFAILWRVFAPLAKPALATVALFSFMWTWNDFLRPLIYLNDAATYTLSLGLQQFQTAHGAEWALLMAASTLVVLPMVLLFFFAQRTFIQGITMTGLKE